MPEMSEARKRANKKWNDENLATRYDHIHLALPAGYKEKIQKAAGKNKVNEFIRKAIDHQLESAEDE